MFPLKAADSGHASSSGRGTDSASRSVDGDVVAALTWREVERRIEQGAIGVLPIGAASKSHGLHLPMNTDQIQAEFLAARIADAVDALIWPTISYGHYPAFTAYSGSSSLSAPAYEAMVGEIAAGILSSRVRALIVVDTGISTIAPTARALGRLSPGLALHVCVHQGPRYREVAARLAEQNHGSHADEIETSLMLAIAPDVVDMPRAEASPQDRRGVTGPLTRTDTSSRNYSASGSYGDPTKATREKGEILLAAMLEDVIAESLRFASTDGRCASQADQRGSAIR